MRIRVGCEMAYQLPGQTPMIAILNVHQDHADALDQPDMLRTEPQVAIETYFDGFGNKCARFVAPAGSFTMTTHGIVATDGAPDPVAWDAVQHPVEELPADVLVFLLGSRYCETDRLSDEAWKLFSHTPEGWPRVQTICDFVHQHITFGYEHSRPTRTAMDAYSERQGVCRDFTHLAVTFCRCMNIPTRYCTGYVTDIGVPGPHGPMDFAAWMEVYLGGQWWVFDPRNNAPRIGRILVARGRDAADVPLTHTFGPNVLSGFRVWAE